MIADRGALTFELVALVLILYGIVSIPWLIIPAVVMFALMESAARRQRGIPRGW